GAVAAGPLPAWLDPAAPFGASPFAVAMRVSLVAGLATAAVALLGRRWSERGRVRVLAVLLGAALAGMSVAGHAASYGGAPFAVIDWLHLLAVAVWLGALPGLIVLARRSSADGRTILRRHGRVALIAAPLVALTGIANSPLVLGASRDLVASDYGNLLLAKAGLMAVALGIGAVNHLTLRGRGRSATAALVAVELVVAAVAVSAAATLVTIQPASARPPVLTAPPVNPAHLFGTVGGADLHATVNPPSPGNQSIQVSLTDAASGLPLEDVEAVTAALSAPEGSQADARRVDLHPADEVPGLFGANGTYTPDEGDWALTLIVQRNGTTAEIDFVVPVSRQAPAEPVPAPDTGVVAPAPLAAIWAVLPSGILGWLPPVGGLLALLLTRRLRPSSARTALRFGVVAVVVVGGIGAATRSIVDAANAPATALLETPPASPDAVRGEAIYLANCASCHGRDGSGDGPIETVPHPPPLAEVVPGTTSGELSYRIAYGVAGTPMPAFAGTLTRDERWALVAYLRERWGTGP
ncbi:MAG: c-type cytochrome, partial [Chloroflexota bacterium]|nr:c-type cytochrome [Chloroflexota bacterium]